MSSDSTYGFSGAIFPGVSISQMGAGLNTVRLNLFKC
jgi:hypothetical protein